MRSATEDRLGGYRNWPTGFRMEVHFSEKELKIYSYVTESARDW